MVPTMRNVISLACHDIAGSGKSGEIAGASDFHAGVGAMSAAQRKVDDSAAAAGVDAARRFGGDQAFADGFD